MNVRPRGIETIPPHFEMLNVFRRKGRPTGDPFAGVLGELFY
jgi:hypothetical protein